ncbi:DNA-processing protein DprA [Patescibacteria group bacterium]|nr:DNA-processing protein DprA [Patescibacteria group bacterium]MCL5798382.1 DNA-processing protein DprA [Patescibacteria group bacterium]
MDNDEKKYWLGFSAFPGIGPLRFALLLKFFKTAQKAWEAKREKLLEIGLGEKLTESFCAFRMSFSLKDYIELLNKKSIRVLTLKDSTYPKLLKEIAAAPFVLYIRTDGEIAFDDERNIAVVGTRKITSYGREVTARLTRDLVAFGCTIVSGMAYGVDTVAHHTAIESGGRTIAVLGCGVDVIHPQSNTPLYWNIVRKYGMVISEFPAGQYASKGLFPARNRIISGLSRGVLVTEGAEDSGALITARCAVEQGREVFAIPGPITSSLSAGPAKLLKQGAKLVAKVEDILEELNIRNMQINKLSNRQMDESMIELSIEERKILEILQNENMHFDEIIRRTGLESAKLGGLLTVLEMKGIVKNFGAGMFGWKRR